MQHGYNTPRWRLILMVVGTLASVTVISALYLSAQGNRTLLPDEGTYSYVGWAWAHGDQLYRDAWDHKGPLVFVITALRSLVLDSSAKWVGVQEVVLGLLTATCCGFAAWRLWGAGLGAVVCVLATLAWTHVGPAGGLVSTAGSLIALLTSIGLLLTVLVASEDTRRRAALLVLFGIVQGLLFATKPNAIVTAPLILLGVMAVVPSARACGHALALVGVGALSTVSLIGLAFLASGTIPDAIYALIGFNMVRAASAYSEQGIIGIGMDMLRILRNIGSLAPLVALALGTCVMVMIDDRRKGWRNPKLRLTLLLAPAWVLLELLALASNGAYVHHAFTLQFAVAFGIGAVLYFAATGDGRSNMSLPGRVALVALAATPWLTGLASLDPRENPPGYLVTASYLRQTTAPEERILFFPGMSGPATLFTAQRKSANRYMSGYGLNLAGAATDAKWDEYADALDGPSAVRTVLADLYSNPQWAHPDSLQQMVNQLDLFRGSLGAGRSSFPGRDRAKRLLTTHYRVEHCDGVLCVLRRRPPPAS